MPMTTEQSVIGGRETFGEPKKLGQVTLDRDGDRVPGTVTRLGTTIIEIDRHASATPIETDRRHPHRLLLQVPARARRQGLRRRAVARLLPPRRDDPRGPRASTARSILRESRFDPVADLPVRRLVEHHARRAPQRPAGRDRRAGCPAEWLLPFVHQRYDDLVARRRRLSEPGRPRRAGSRSSPAAPAASAGRWASASPAEGMKVVLADVEAPALDADRRRAARRDGLDVTGVVTDVRRLRVGRGAARRGARARTARSTCVCNNAGVGAAPRARCGTTRSTTGAGRSA